MAMKFMAACGADFEAMRTVEFFAAHEALILDYERPMTRIDSRTGLAYDTSAHFVWVGERTRDLDGAHVDFVSRIQNPVGVKVSANAEPDQPQAARQDRPRPGARAFAFITRMGARSIRDALPAIVERVTDSGALVTWICDPMHGNTFSSTTGYKTRTSTTSSTRSMGSSTSAGAGDGSRRDPRRAHRQRRDRVPGRVGEDPRRRPREALRVGVRPAPQPPAEPGAGVPRRGDAGE